MATGKRKSGPKFIPRQTACVVCGIEFTSKRRKHIYCGYGCKAAWWAKIREAGLRALSIER